MRPIRTASSTHPIAFDTTGAPFYISDMRLIACLALLILPAFFGCSSPAVPPPRTAEENQLFGPVSMKLDTFSKVKDWDADGIPNGIEALVEFDDRFGDRTKAAGVIVFELYDYRPYWPIRAESAWPIPGRLLFAPMTSKKPIGKPPAEPTCSAWPSIRRSGITVTF